MFSKIFNFFKVSKLTKDNLNVMETTPSETSKLTGDDFEFLITPSDIEIEAEDFDSLMTPDSIHWTKEIKNNWTYYKVDNDEFFYSWEEPGIQMAFNEKISYNKAKLIADEVVSKLSKYTGQEITLIYIPKDKIIHFV